VSAQYGGFGAYLERVTRERTPSVAEARSHERRCLLQEVRDLEEKLARAYERLDELERLMDR
jgi:hypothetical protein